MGAGSLKHIKKHLRGGVQSLQVFWFVCFRCLYYLIYSHYTIHCIRPRIYGRQISAVMHYSIVGSFAYISRYWA